MPTLYMTGTDDRGRSRVVERRELSVDTDPVTVHAVDGEVPTVPPCSSPAALLEQHRMAPGSSRWLVYAWRPGVYTDFHRTTSIDFDIVLSGSVELQLETETVVLEAGDCAFLPGTVHAWRAGPAGGVVGYSIVSAEAPDSDADKPRLPSSAIMHMPSGKVAR